MDVSPTLPTSKQYGAWVAVIKGGSIVDHRTRFSSLNASYDNFLYAPVCEDANGTHLTVLSALARTDVDPWEGATRLAAMPKAVAETTLLSILDLVSGRSWKSPEAAAVAARLVGLLPQPGEPTAVAPTQSANAATAATGHAKLLGLGKSYWWVWLGFWMAMSFMVPHHQATTTTAGAAITQTDAPSSIKSNAPDPIGQSR